MYRVTWQREIKIEESEKRVVKRNKRSREFHDFLLSFSYCLLSFILLHPSRPFSISKRSYQISEGRAARKMLNRIGVKTPKLFEIQEDFLVEELIGKDLYDRLKRADRTDCERIGYEIGCLTAKVHLAGLGFTDNKAQNYLMKDGEIYRTDLSLMQKREDIFLRSIDIGSFLASIMDLDHFSSLQEGFCQGYASTIKERVDITAFLLRNILSLGFTPNYFKTVPRMLVDVRKYL